MKASNGFKICSHCRKNLSISEYHKNRTTHDGFGNECKFCLSEIRERNLEKKHEYDKQYCLVNAEQQRQKANDWYYANHEYAIDRSKEYYRNHIEEHRVNSRNWKQNNPERLRVLRGRHKAKRRNMGFFKLWKNPFPEDVQIDWHHVNKMLVVPMPRRIHNKCSHLNPEEHRERCNVWLYQLYGLDFNKLLKS